MDSNGVSQEILMGLTSSEQGVGVLSSMDVRKFSEENQHEIQVGSFWAELTVEDLKRQERDTKK